MAPDSSPAATRHGSNGHIDGGSSWEEKPRSDSVPDSPPETPEHPPMKTVAIVMASLYVAMFLVGLDRIIISTALPRITDAFNSIDDIGWYGSAYVLASCATQLLFGRLYAFFSNKMVFLGTIVIFEAGSALCAAAPNSIAFILGRVLAGVGSAGVFSGVIVIMVPLIPLEKRPIFQGLLGAIFGISSILGPLIGGAFTSNVHLTWRWCFWINLPIGGASMVAIILFLHMPEPPEHRLPALEKAKRMDPLGTLLFAPSIVCLLLALQWGGTTYAWNSGRIIALLVLFALLFVSWVVVELFWLGENATVPRRIFVQRSIMAAVAFSTCIGGAMLVFSYYIAIWFQAITGVDALQSGIRTLPFVLALVAASIMSGGGVSRFGYYTPFVLASACLMPVGMGLLSTLKVHSSQAQWVGYQFIAGFGMGLGLQMSGLAAQVVLEPRDVAMGASMMFFGQGLGGSIFTCVGENIFLRQLLENLSHVVSEAEAKKLTSLGATAIRSAVSPDQLPAVLVEYNKAITTTFYVALAVACVSIIPAVFFEWRSVKAEKKTNDVESGRAAEGPVANELGK